MNLQPQDLDNLDHRFPLSRRHSSYTLKKKKLKGIPSSPPPPIPKNPLSPVPLVFSTALSALAMNKVLCMATKYLPICQLPNALGVFRLHNSISLQEDSNKNNHNYDNNKSEGEEKGWRCCWCRKRCKGGVFSFLEPVSLCKAERVRLLWREVSRGEYVVG